MNCHKHSLNHDCWTLLYTSLYSWSDLMICLDSELFPKNIVWESCGKKVCHSLIHYLQLVVSWVTVQQNKTWHKVRPGNRGKCIKESTDHALNRLSKVEPGSSFVWSTKNYSKETIYFLGFIGICYVESPRKQKKWPTFFGIVMTMNWTRTETRSKFLSQSESWKKLKWS